MATHCASKGLCGQPVGNQHGPRWPTKPPRWPTRPPRWPTRPPRWPTKPPRWPPVAILAWLSQLLDGRLLTKSLLAIFPQDGQDGQPFPPPLAPSGGRDNAKKAATVKSSL